VGALFRTSANQLLDLSNSRVIGDKIATQMFHVIGNFPSESEKKSWNESFNQLAIDLVEAKLGELEVLLEFQMPYSSARADAIICGFNSKGSPTVLVVELKQWTNFERVEGTDDLVRVASYGNNLKLHPSEQVRQYCEYLKDFNLYLENSFVHLYGAAYLHNWLGAQTESVLAGSTTKENLIFTGSEKKKWIDFLNSIFTNKEGKEVADGPLNGKLAPSKQLLNLAADEIRDREKFVLLDEQKVAYSVVLDAVKKSTYSNQKTAVIISGGPGSGKSVIALSLLGELARQGKSVLHATGSKAFRNSLRKIAGAKSSSIQKMFTYFNSYTQSEPNSLDVLICDEAHRIRITSANRYTNAENRTGTPQIVELLRSARTPVFLLDSYQVVRKGEIGTPQYIKDASLKLGIEVLEINLEDQFRLGGSKSYEGWLISLLEMSDQSPSRWEEDMNFKVETVDSPSLMEKILQDKIREGFSARITAGFCWNWRDPNPDGTLPLDVQIGDWKKPWNVKGDRGVGGYLNGSLWAIDPKGFDQVGCIYTAQGFEYHWNGVILGPDLVWRNGKWVGIPSESKDPDMRGINEETFLKLVKNTYKVLLTRGLVGTLIYSVDNETQDYLKTLIN
jgi:uncharacterized protein